jgi:hypothetical protein
MIGWMMRKHDEEGRLWQMSMGLGWIIGITVGNPIWLYRMPGNMNSPL